MSELGMMARSAVVELADGRKYRMDFDLGALANAEGVYEDRFGRIANASEIIAELALGRARALMAFAYGAMISAGETLTWEDFGKNVYTYENYSQLSEITADAIVAMMRSDGEAGEGDSKNAHSRGGD